MNVFIDTQIWVYSFKKPLRVKFENEKAYEEAVLMHNTARKLVKDSLVNHTIYLTTHQLAELFHVLAFKGVKMDKKDALEILEKISGSSKTVIINVKKKHYKKALKLSNLSGIHIWDYLCILPLKGLIDIAYTNDKHFLHPTLKNQTPKLENPLGKWREL